ncbi:hypothetical protein HY091_01065 [Candidatus Kaiserbacteria bacterium]|nr:hypothetical protein [Candidatus Kaiserbacteria bacterium]
MPAQKEYIVALRYTKEAGGYAGVVTWTVSPSKAAFDAQFKDYKDLEVVEEGISEERAIQLCKSTPPQSLLLAALQDATDRETGHINFLLLRGNIERALFGIQSNLT